MIYNEDILCHHGIKGQRWGIRRTPEQLDRHRSGTKKRAKQKSPKASRIKKSIIVGASALAAVGTLEVLEQVYLKQGVKAVNKVKDDTLYLTMNSSEIKALPIDLSRK